MKSAKFKYFYLLISFVLLFTIFLPYSKSLKAINISIDESKIEAISIKEVVDGIEPFDANNERGNDANASNGIVRSFDDINYTLEYVTALKTNKPLEAAYIMVKIDLPYPKEVATFNLDAMSWMIDPQITEDPETHHQVLLGKRLLKNTASKNSIPGIGTLSVGIKVQAAPNQTKIQPSFSLWMEGNTEDEVKTINNSVTIVSAAPKYSINIQKNTMLDSLDYYNFNTGEKGTANDGVSIKGRMEGYGLSFELLNDSSEKKLKGLELPKGDISFILTLKQSESESSNNNDSSVNDSFIPLIWDHVNQSKIEPFATRGNWNRNLFWKGNKTGVYPYCSAPLSYNNKADFSTVKNSGKWTVDKISKNQYRVTIRDYEFDENYVFPHYGYNANTDSPKQFKDNEGIFATSYFQILLRLPEDVASPTNYYLTVEASDIETTSMSNDKVSIQPDKATSKHVSSITLYPPGSMSKDLRLRKWNEDPNIWTDYLSTFYYTGDSAAMTGTDFCLENELYFKSDYVTRSVDYFVKFDGNALEPSGNKNDYRARILCQDAYLSHDKFKILYAAKPDGSNWNNNDEFNESTEKDMIFYDSLEELKQSGKLCVGYLYEIRNTDMYTSSFTLIATLSNKLTVKNDSNLINKTYPIISSFTLWHDDIDHTYSHNSGSVQPPNDGRVDNHNIYYIKTEYDDSGIMQEGTHNGGCLYGQSLLVIGYESRVSQEIVQKDINGNEKTAFDMDINERTVTYNIQPSIYHKSKVDKNTDIIVREELPPSLTYIPGTAYYGLYKKEPEITPMENGWNALVWKFTNISINNKFDTISFSCKIGKPGTIKDVKNNEGITTIAKISGKEDFRVHSSKNQNLYYKSFSCIKLNAISIYKDVDKPIVNKGEDFAFTLSFANNSQNKLGNSSLYDILPYNKDIRNSNFHGGYKITSITLDFTNAPKTFSKFNIAKHPVKMSKDLSLQTADFETINNFKSWYDMPTNTKPSDKNVIVDNLRRTITYTSTYEDITALKFDIDLEGLESVDIKIAVSPTTKDLQKQQDGDVYVNNFYQYADKQIAKAESNNVSVQILDDITITKKWSDFDNKFNTRSDIEVNIYQNGHFFKKIKLTDTNKVDAHTWEYHLQGVPKYTNTGSLYQYTIEEIITPTLKETYKEPEYDQTNLIVFNNVKVKSEMLTHRIIFCKQIVNAQGKEADIEDFESINMNKNEEHLFLIKLRDNTGKNISYQGILSDKGDLIFNNIRPGTYVIEELPIQNFDFIKFEEMTASSDSIKLEKKDGEYLLTIPETTEQDELIKIKTINKIKDFSPYASIDSEENLYKK